MNCHSPWEHSSVLDVVHAFVCVCMYVCVCLRLSPSLLVCPLVVQLIVVVMSMDVFDTDAAIMAQVST